jgi:hypothetical protein
MAMMDFAIVAAANNFTVITKKMGAMPVAIQIHYIP